MKEIERKIGDKIYEGIIKRKSIKDIMLSILSEVTIDVKEKCPECGGYCYLSQKDGRIEHCNGGGYITKKVTLRELIERREM